MDFLDQGDIVRAKSQRLQQTGGCGLCRDFRALAVFDTDLLPVLESAVELWCGSTQVAELELTAERF